MMVLYGTIFGKILKRPSNEGLFYFDMISIIFSNENPSNGFPPFFR